MEKKDVVFLLIICSIILYFMIFSSLITIMIILLLITLVLNTLFFEKNFDFFIKKIRKAYDVIFSSINKVFEKISTLFTYYMIAMPGIFFVVFIASFFLNNFTIDFIYLFAIFVLVIILVIDYLIFYFINWFGIYLITRPRLLRYTIAVMKGRYNLFSFEYNRGNFGNRGFYLLPNINEDINNYNYEERKKIAVKRAKIASEMSLIITVSFINIFLQIFSTEDVYLYFTNQFLNIDNLFDIFFGLLIILALMTPFNFIYVSRTSFLKSGLVYFDPKNLKLESPGLDDEFGLIFGDVSSRWPFLVLFSILYYSTISILYPYSLFQSLSIIKPFNYFDQLLIYLIVCMIITFVFVIGLIIISMIFNIYTFYLLEPNIMKSSNKVRDQIETLGEFFTANNIREIINDYYERLGERTE